jgi:hypothetical protein
VERFCSVTEMASGIAHTFFTTGVTVGFPNFWLMGILQFHNTLNQTMFQAVPKTAKISRHGEFLLPERILIMTDFPAITTTE